MNQDVRKMDSEMLIAILDRRVEFESSNEAEIVDFIREVVHRRLWLEFGANNMFDFLTRARYRYAPAVAQRKLDAARLMQFFPEVKDYLISEEVNLTQLGMLGSGFRQKPVSPKVQREILEAIRGQTIKNTQVILNEMLEIEVKPRPKVRVQRDGSVRVEMTFSKEQWEVMERVKEVVSHSVPSGEWTEVLSYCARFTISKKDHSTSPKRSSAENLSTEAKDSVSQKGFASKGLETKEGPLLPSMEVKVRHGVTRRKCKVRDYGGVSRSTRRLVHQRDQSCRHIHPDGTRCESRYQLQVDHIISRWKGGGNELENLQLLCGLHNRYKYEREVGEAS